MVGKCYKYWDYVDIPMHTGKHMHTFVMIDSWGCVTHS